MLQQLWQSRQHLVASHTLRSTGANQQLPVRHCQYVPHKQHPLDGTRRVAHTRAAAALSSSSCCPSRHSINASCSLLQEVESQLQQRWWDTGCRTVACCHTFHTLHLPHSCHNVHTPYQVWWSAGWPCSAHIIPSTMQPQHRGRAITNQHR